MDFKHALIKALMAHTDLNEEQLQGLIEIPPQREMGDYAFPCFALAKTLRKAPPVIASELAASLVLPEGFLEAKPMGPYLNFFVDPVLRARAVLAAVTEKGERYGSGDEGQGRVVTMDFSSINIAKPFHIGHLSSTVIGHALYNLYAFLGYQPVGINHLGDWGTQFGKLIVAFDRWGDRATIDAGGVRELLKIYVRFHDEAEKDDSLNEEARSAFRDLENGDPRAVELYDWFKEITLKEVSHIYDILGITFDSYAGESFYNDKMDRVVDELKEKGLLVQDQGAWVVEFPEEEKMPPCLILKADGATLYATRDIAAALYRKEHYHFYKSLYVVAYQQNLHFRQLFKVIEMMGYEWAKDMVHVAFGMVSMEEGTLSTRSGRVIFLDEVFAKATERARKLIEEKSPDLENKDSVAQQVGVGALVYNTLSAGRIKDITFSWDRALNFDGETGPYCQYSHARCCRILRKANHPLPALSTIDYSALSDRYAQEVLRQIGDFPEAIRRAVDENEPHLVTRCVTRICQAYSKFYDEKRIVDAPENERDARLVLTNATRNVIRTGLHLLGIQAPEQI